MRCDVDGQPAAYFQSGQDFIVYISSAFQNSSSDELTFRSFLSCIARAAIRRSLPDAHLHAPSDHYDFSNNPDRPQRAVASCCWPGRNAAGTQHNRYDSGHAARTLPVLQSQYPTGRSRLNNDTSVGKTNVMKLKVPRGAV
jgi:hypothetical protein